MLIVGLTGGIGSGKSTVARLFSERGVPVIDTDIIAREMTKPGSAAYPSIIKHFTQTVLLPDGSLDRGKLREIIFANAKQRLWLENLLHPLIRHNLEQQIKKLTAPYCIAVIPLLFEVEFYSLVNRILVIDAPESLQIKRVMARDHIPQSRIQAILDTQASREDRVARAHDVIVNDGDLANLVVQVDKLHEIYLQTGQQKGK